MKKNSWKQKLKSFVSNILVGVALFFLIRYFVINRVELLVALKQTNPLFMSIGAVFTVFVLVLMSVGWTLAVQLAGGKMKFRDGFRIYFLSSILRYLPGSIWYVPGRGYLSQKVDITPLEFSASVVLELFYLLAMASALGGTALAQKLGAEWLWFSAASVALMSCFVAYPDLLRLPPVRKYLKIIPSRKKHLQLIMTYFLVWLCFGISIAVFLQAFDISLRATDVFGIITGNAAAWLIGFFSFVPLGLGVRESVLVWLYGPLVPTNIIVLMSFVQRGVEVLLELILWGIVARLGKYSAVR